MDYQNRAGSKKGGGGIASQSQQNVHRRKQVEDLLRGGEDVPYTFQHDSADKADDEAKLKRNPYIYKNHSGKLVCKLCNTMHMSWSSVERHLGGKKHGLNLLRRGGSTAGADDDALSKQDREFHTKVEEMRQQIKHNGVVPKVQFTKVKDPETEHIGIAVRVDYKVEGTAASGDEEEPPCLRILSGLELPGAEDDDKKYLVVAYEPFENIAIEIPDKEIVMSKRQSAVESIDELNGRCSYWDRDDKAFYVQLFFKQ
ncbi:AEL014Cp [Eremothecium gossypii ATCC 10895]|uniref:AEL014Cp n=1 Tax=Eremothecium gossypii (strain ATCC 10895 / CBS 109.51 / FGSC 9923 / NRRL Y-1056) TaxID=284811 RepID=Q757M2_EREGS|nr:AEL014Cp [Eremothecium gossypii ATCC 10895]AAS52671.1 AEL014Cp [Eremothecium gossypii ATCC 10895]AEY96976.1 FAEL014Cp [Eremothecium gossypii FDAG1]